MDMEVYKERRRKEAVRFCAAAGVALVSSRLLMRKVAPPVVDRLLLRPTSFMTTPKLLAGVKTQSGKDIATALVYSTGIVTGVIGMGLFGTCWINDIVSVREFHEWIRFH